MMNTNRTLKLTTLALCGVINILGGTIALLLRLPVYLDSIGTILAAVLVGVVLGQIMRIWATIQKRKLAQ